VRKILLLVASLALLLILARAAGFHHIGETWRRIPGPAILLSMACFLGSIAMRILAWKALLGAGVPSPWALAPTLAVGFVLGSIVPAKAGEPAVALLASRGFGVPLARTLSALAAERGVQLIVLLTAFVAAVALRAGTLLDVRSAALAAAIVLVAILAGVFLARPHFGRAASAARRIPRIGPALAASFVELDTTLRDRPLLLRLVVLASLFWLLQFLSLWAILTGGGLSIDLAGAAVVAGAAILGSTISFLPLGTQDGISAVVLRAFGVPLATGFALALFHTMLSLACSAALVVLMPWFGVRGAPRDSDASQG
jgi:uncharacterized membrane protein YbhN (UPF0104 family)